MPSRARGPLLVVHNLAFGGYVGGAREDAALWVPTDRTGAVYLVGDAGSDQTTFPDGDGFGTIRDNDQTHDGGLADAFIVKVD